MRLLVISEGIVEELSLIVMFLELLSSNTLLDTAHLLRMSITKKLIGLETDESR